RTLPAPAASPARRSSDLKIDGAATYTTGSSVAIPAPADHSNDGTHTITYRSTDAVGNVETAKTATVRIDTIAPATTDNAPAGWSKTTVTVALAATDAASG